MTDTVRFGALLAAAAGVGLVAVLSHHVTRRIKVPVPALMLALSAIAVAVIPQLHPPSAVVVERLVTVALICILFDGGCHIGLRRFRAAAAPIALTGVLATFATTAAISLLLHTAFGLDWYASLLVATAIAPTDPAVVFSVLGGTAIAGRSSTILEGESGANDPVGIALMVALIQAHELSGHAFASVAGQFLLQMSVGLAIGVVGSRALLEFMRRVALPSEALYPLRTLAGVLLIYGVASIAHGSGFLAVFVAGICIGDDHAPYKAEVARFHSSLASLGEIVAFVVLGLTIDLAVLGRSDVLIPGLVVAVVLAVIVRPLVVGVVLLPARLPRNELSFVLFAGLKGAVPILLAELIQHANLHDHTRLFSIVVIVVMFSVVVQGSAVPMLVRALRLPLQDVRDGAAGAAVE